MMKKICNLIICLALSTVAYSQNIVGQHQLRADDQVEKQTVAYTGSWALDPELSHWSCPHDPLGAKHLGPVILFRK